MLLFVLSSLSLPSIIVSLFKYISLLSSLKTTSSFIVTPVISVLIFSISLKLIHVFCLISSLSKSEYTYNKSHFVFPSPRTSQSRMPTITHVPSVMLLSLLRLPLNLPRIIHIRITPSDVTTSHWPPKCLATTAYISPSSFTYLIIR